MAAIFPVCTKGGGVCFVVPDVCLTPAPPAPPVPIPYPNTGTLNQCKKNSTKVKIKGKEVVTKKSEMSRSMGDEAGVNKGVMSGMNMSKVCLKKCSGKVMIQGQACAHLTSMTGHNGSNANAPVGTVIAPGQTSVLCS